MLFRKFEVQVYSIAQNDIPIGFMEQLSLYFFSRQIWK